MLIQHPSVLKKLTKTGLTDKEARVYLSVLELGGAFPSKVAQYAGLNRTTTYHLLNRLAVQGLVNEIEKKNKIFYQIDKPKKLVDHTKSQRRLVEDRIEIASSVLPDLEGLYGLSGSRPKVTYYQGIEGMLDLYSDHIDVERSYEMLAWANARELQKFLPPKFFDNYVKTKEKKRITTRAIIPDTEENRFFTGVRYKDVNKKLWPEMRFMDPKLFPLVGEITVYSNNKVSIANFERQTLIGTIIEDKAIHDVMVAIFELSWSSSLIKS